MQIFLRYFGKKIRPVSRFVYSLCTIHFSSNGRTESVFLQLAQKAAKLADCFLADFFRSHMYAQEASPQSVSDSPLNSFRQSQWNWNSPREVFSISESCFCLQLKHISIKAHHKDAGFRNVTDFWNLHSVNALCQCTLSMRLFCTHCLCCFSVWFTKRNHADQIMLQTWALN